MDLAGGAVGVRGAPGADARGGRGRACRAGRAAAALAPETADAVLARLAGASLLTFSVDGSAVTAHRLVMRVIRESLAAGDSLTAVCEAAARLLDGLAGSLGERWHEDRAGARDLAGADYGAGRVLRSIPARQRPGCSHGPAQIVGVTFLNKLWRQHSAGHRDRRTAASRPGTRLGPGPPRHPDRALQPGQRLPGRGPHRRGDHLARAGPGRPGAHPGPRPPRHPAIAQQPRQRLPGRRAAPARRSPCTSRPWPPKSASWAPTTPAPLSRAPTLHLITTRRAASARRSPCSSRSGPPKSASWVPTIPPP